MVESRSFVGHDAKERRVSIEEAARVASSGPKLGPNQSQRLWDVAGEQGPHGQIQSQFRAQLPGIAFSLRLHFT